MSEKKENKAKNNRRAEPNFGRISSDRLGIVHLYDAIENLRSNLREDVGEIKEDVNSLQSTMNNGIKHQVERNSDCIEELSEEFIMLQEIIKHNKGYNEGKIKAWQVALAIISSLGGGVIGTLTALSLLGVL